MSSAPKPPGDAWSGQALAPLRGLLELSRLLRDESSLPDALAAIAEIVSRSLGFATVAINMYRPELRDYVVVSVHGDERARDALLGEITSEDSWAPLLEERFHGHGVYFIPEGALDDEGLGIRWYTPELGPEHPQSEGAWRAGDALFATLDGTGGRRYGVISVDVPVSGLRPDDQQLEVLGALAAHAALAIESSRQLAALEAALDRNRAVIASTLECVIAIDHAGRVIDFNPAAERTFQYRADDVIGRELIDLIVPPDLRDAYETGFERAIATDGGPILGRRLEATAMRSDKTVFPVEIAIARVDAASGREGPVFYGFVRDISERRRSEEQLAYLAYHDQLTGLPNRIMVEQQLNLALARARRAGGAVALMFVDLDDFKEVNDRLGHAAGDRLLTSVATRLRSVLRDSDVLARQGGDEFLVLIADLASDAVEAAESVGVKLLEALREPFVIVGTEVRTGASVGISVYPGDADDTEALMRHADAAMYRAKAAGGGRLAFHEAPGPGGRHESTAKRIRRAIAEGEFEVHFQPVWRLTEPREVSGVEAIIRWRSPERGLLEADDFINLAEQSNTGDELLDWVLGESCTQMREWQDAGLMPIVAVNISHHQLLAPGLVARLLERLGDHGLSPLRFVFELPESAWTVDSAQALAVMNELRAAGASLTLDGFGAGYSSLSRLAELEFNAIKLDGSMLRRVPGDEAAVAMLDAVLAVATACDAPVIANGVQTSEQLELLKSRGVARGQGDVLCEPLPGHELTRVLEKHLVRGPRLHRAAMP